MGYCIPGGDADLGYCALGSHDWELREQNQSLGYLTDVFDCADCDAFKAEYAGPVETQSQSALGRFA